MGESVQAETGPDASGDGMFDKFRAEWPAVRDARWSVGSLVFTAFVTGFGVSTLLSSSEINSLKAERDLFKSRIETGQTAAPNPQSVAKPMFQAREKPGAVPEPPNSADYAPRSVAERYLALKYDNATPLQITHLLQPYIGKRLRLTAVLLTAQMRRDHVWVQLDPGGPGRGSLFVAFTPRWAEQLSVIPRGQRVEFDAMIGEGNPPELVDGGLS